MKFDYAFDCKNCAQMQFVKDATHDGEYCTAILRDEVTIHADKDRVLRCSAYKRRSHD